MFVSSTSRLARSTFMSINRTRFPLRPIMDSSIPSYRTFASCHVRYSKDPSVPPSPSPSSPASSPSPSSHSSSSDTPRPSLYRRQESFHAQRQLLPTSSPLTSLPFAQEADIEVPVAAVPDDPRQLFKPSVLREENLVPLAFPPDHPWESLSIHDKIRPNDQRHNPLPTFPRPISVPAYPEPVLPSSPRPVDHLPTVRYRDLPPETMAELYRARIMARPVKGKDQGWVQKAWDMFDAEVDDPNGWVLVREKMGLPPTRADRPASILFWWENLEEEQLWRWLVPFFWVWALVPIIGTGLLVSFFAYDGAFEDENGFRFGKLGWGVPQPPVRKELA